MQDNVEKFLRLIGEEWLLDGFGVVPRFRVQPLPELFAPCPMCAGSTNVDFGTSRAFCEICKQKWNLRGEPIAGERGNVEVWRRRQRYIEERKNGKGNGHRYSFDEPIRLEDFANAKI